MKRIMLALSALLVVMFATSCADNPTPTNGGEQTNIAITGTPVDVDGGTYWRLTPAQFYSLTRDSRVYLVNLDKERTFYISGTKMYLDADIVSSNLARFPSDKTTVIAIYCSVGTKSPDVAAILVQAGYSNVAELNDGWLAWQRQGYPLQSSS